MNEEPLYGLLAEFKEPEKLVEVAKRAREKGYRLMDGFSPYPVEGLPEALDSHRTKIPAIALTGALIGALGGYFMLYSSAVAFYPINVAGRPLHSWPMFIPIIHRDGNAGLERSSEAAPSAFRGSTIFAGDGRSFFLLHPGQRPVVRSRQVQRIPE